LPRFGEGPGLSRALNRDRTPALAKGENDNLTRFCAHHRSHFERNRIRAAGVQSLCERFLLIADFAAVGAVDPDRRAP